MYFRCVFLLVIFVPIESQDMPCPIPVCLPLPPDCVPVDQFRIIDGNICRWCSTCEENTCPILRCPPLPQDCDKIIPQHAIIDGRKCPMCPKCFRCPKCPAQEGCKIKYKTIDGVRCPICRVCKYKKRRACPVPRCVPPSPGCDPVPNYEKINGQRCQMCYRCRRRYSP